VQDEGKTSEKISGRLQLSSEVLKFLTAHQEPVEDVEVTLRRLLAFENDNVFRFIIPRMTVLVR
jgi:hypothetical protein